MLYQVELFEYLRLINMLDHKRKVKIVLDGLR